MNASRRSLQLYWGVVGLVALLLGWWFYFFYRQGDFLVSRIERAGGPLAPEQAEAVRHAARESLRMFVFEGGFLGLLLLASVWLVVRTLAREVALIRQQKNFLSAVTHELRSPIASARLYIESLLLGRAEGEKRERYLRHAQQDLDRLRDQVDALLESARLGSATPTLRPERVDLAIFAAHHARRFGQLHEERRVHIDIDAHITAAVHADPAALETILSNLLSNAVKYGGEEPRVEVSVHAAEGRAVLAVRDFGPGLQGVDPAAIFKPFVRGEAAHVQAKAGVGLGLYLVAELTRALGGNARAFDGLEGGGTRFEIELPLYEASLAHAGSAT